MPSIPSIPPRRIRLKARVDRADQTTRIYTQKYVKTVVLMRQGGVELNALITEASSENPKIQSRCITVSYRTDQDALNMCAAW